MNQIQKMLEKPGVYIVSHPNCAAVYAVVRVDASGVCRQVTTFDRILSPDGWIDNAHVRGPLTMDTPTLGDKT